MNTTNNAVANNSNVAMVVGANDSVYAAKGTVGLNDSVIIDAGKVNVVATVDNSKRIDALIVERKAWEQGAMRTSNEQLYALLAKCYAFYWEMRGNDKDAKAVRKVLDAQVEKLGYRFNESTHVLTKLVKCVFGADRRRVSAYSLVLREALAQDKTAGDIAAFITQGGGVEEIRRSKSKTAKTPAQKAELGKQAVGNSELAVASGDKLAVKLDVNNAGDDMVAIVTQQADGSLVVRAVINSKTVLKAALACAYAQNKAALQKEEANSKPTEGDKKQQQLIDEAAKETVAA